MEQIIDLSKHLEIIVEKHDGLLWGRIEDQGNFMPTPYGETKQLLIENLAALIQDYISHEGKHDAVCNSLDVNNLQYSFKYDLQSFFQEHNYLNEQAGLNHGLVRQYASGVKHPSAEQADKIRNAIKKIGKGLSEDLIYAG